MFNYYSKTIRNLAEIISISQYIIYALFNNLILLHNLDVFLLPI